MFSWDGVFLIKVHLEWIDLTSKFRQDLTWHNGPSGLSIAILTKLLEIYRMGFLFILFGWEFPVPKPGWYHMNSFSHPKKKIAKRLWMDTSLQANKQNLRSASHGSQTNQWYSLVLAVDMVWRNSPPKCLKHVETAMCLEGFSPHFPTWKHGNCDSILTSQPSAEGKMWSLCVAVYVPFMKYLFIDHIPSLNLDIAPTNGCLEDVFPIGMVYLQGLCLFQGG